MGCGAALDFGFKRKFFWALGVFLDFEDFAFDEVFFACGVMASGTGGGGGGTAASGGEASNLSKSDTRFSQVVESNKSGAVAELSEIDVSGRKSESLELSIATGEAGRGGERGFLPPFGFDEARVTGGDDLTADELEVAFSGEAEARSFCFKRGQVDL